MKNLLILMLLFCLASCQTKPDRTVSIYFDTDSLMQRQKQLLYKGNAQISKWARVNDKTSEGTIKPDSVDAWDREFQMLEKININKSALQGYYEEKEYNDPYSNLKVKEYAGLSDDLEVPYLKLYYLDTPDNIRIIEAEYVENNPVYHSKRNLKFVFNDFTGSSLLHKYSVKGIQKMIFKDSVNFEIKAEIKL
ncbi:hypothetical protein JMN32_07395 [Fulvivirga sp. 29W222]|uniref:Uncharacterized protein n=1 Tax=Fulvivirga marina TaxID=2494733 RepID=A0A937G093_9BACT|nr:hypothetical protein [Fulvivirga marina]MBL6446126.1 hypothetical protein [Fulvivirga marina]